VKYYDLGDDLRKQYQDALQKHIKSVQEAGKELGVSPHLLMIHDLSKWSEEEFVPYALHFFGGGAPNLFAPAWLHHIHYNPHHWQHWVFPDNFELKGANTFQGTVMMPEEYALEMIADWIGASRVYSNTDDMSKWLRKSVPKIKLHPATREYVTKILKDIGYKSLFEEIQFSDLREGNGDD